MKEYKGKLIVFLSLFILINVSINNTGSLISIADTDTPFYSSNNNFDEQENLILTAEGDNIELLSQIDDNDDGRPVSSTISGNYLYVADYFSMVIYDISIIEKPLRVSGITLTGTVKEIVIIDDIAHVVADYGGYYIINITDPTNPMTLGSYDGSDTSFIDLAIQEDIAYLVDRGYTTDSGLILLNISDSWNPSFLNEMRFPSYLDYNGDVYVKGSIIFHAKTGSNGLGIYNVSDPYNITEIGSYGTEAYNKIILHDDLLYVSPSSNLEKFFALNVSDLSAPSLVTINSVSLYSVQDMFIDGDILFTTGKELGIFNITDPINPFKLGSYETSASHSYSDIEVWNKTAYLTGNKRQYILNIENPVSPILLSQIIHEGSSMDLALYGNYAYSAEMDAGLEIYDISNKSKPREVGNFTIYEGLNDAQLRQVEIKGDYLFVLESWEGVVIYNLTIDPVHPTEVTRINSFQGFSFTIQGNYMYVIEANIQVYDISNLENPIHVGELDDTTDFFSMHNIEIQGNLMIGKQQKTLHFIDLSDPIQPVLVTSYEVQFESRFDFISDFTVFEHFLLISSTFGNSIFLDFSDLENVVPTTAFSNMVSSVEVFHYYEQLLYIVTDTSFIIGNLTEAGLFGFLVEIPIDAPVVHSLTLYGQYAFLSLGVDGTQIYLLPTNLKISPQDPPVVTTSISETSSSVSSSSSESITSLVDQSTISPSSSASITPTLRTGIRSTEFFVILMGAFLSITFGRRWVLHSIRGYLMK